MNRSIDCVDCLHELVSLSEEKIDDTKEYRHLYYYTRPTCMYNNIHMYVPQYPII